MPERFRVAIVSWREHEPTLRRIREVVFIREQRVPAEIEYDGIDDDCLHAIAYAPDDSAIGTGRLLPDGHVGRMAVYEAWRGKGIGGMILEALVEAARGRGDAEVILHSQVHAIPFYERHGFVAYGDIFQEADIDHRKMRRVL